MLSSAVRTAVGSVAASRIVAPVLQRRLSFSVNVVYAHDVGNATPHTASFFTGLTLDRFRRDLRLLRSRFEFASLRDVVEGDQRSRQERPLLALTFDDGFDLIRAGVLDVLTETGVPATTFVITSCLDNRDLMWRNKLSAILASVDEAVCLAAYRRVAQTARLPEIQRCKQLLAAAMDWPVKAAPELATLLWNETGMPPLDEYLALHRPYFTSGDLEEWLRAGNGIGLHTRTHPLCSRLDDAGISAEVVAPARELRSRFECDWLPLSYPFGDRLAPSAESDLVAGGIVDCAFGIRGFARYGTPPRQLERACLDADLRFHVFGRVLLTFA